MAFHNVSARSRMLARSTALILFSGLTAACSTSSMTTGATGASPAANTGQPMPPALVGTNPITNGAQTFAALPPTAGGGTAPQPAVTTAALPPATGATYPAPTANQPPTTAPLPAEIAAAPQGQGTTVTVEPGQTLYSLSRSYGVSVSAIAAANGLTQTSLLDIGQRIVIPPQGQLGTPPAPLGTITQTTGGGQPTQIAAAAPAAAAGAQLPSQHVVRQGETIYSIAMAYGVSPNALAQANNMPSPDVVRVGQTLNIPGATRAPAPAPAAAAPTPPTQVAAVTTAPTPAPAAATPTAAPAQTAAVAPATVGTPSVNGTSFRWPAHGRIISDFGPKPGGDRNDGINIALPEGTEILAAEAGTVIYAGNEIPGYGNLVLIRHADNWVTAYAHASQMMVSKDQTVSRGQTIALVGQSGSVSSPQLHFELRRGSTPVNPLDYLAE